MTTRDAVRLETAHLRFLRYLVEDGRVNEWGLRDRHGNPLPDPGVTDRRWRRLARGCTAAVAGARHDGLDEA